MWASNRQASVSLSSMEAELVALSETLKSSLWLARLLGEFGYAVKPELLVDNQATIKLVQNPQFHKRSKHIEVRHYFVREKYQRKEIEIRYCPSESNLADMLTKALPKPRFQELKLLAEGRPDDDSHNHLPDSNRG